MRRAMPLGVRPVLLAALLMAAPSAHALVWPDVPERIERDLGAADPAVRLAATEKLESLGTARAAPLVLRTLADGDSNVRVAAADAAVRLRVTGATALVIPWLAERDTRLRIKACEVAHALPDPHTIAPLARVLSDADGAVRASAAEALGVQGSTDAVAPLLGKLDDSNPTVRVELATALARIGDKRAVVPLVGKVEDSVPEVRQAVAKALGELGDPRAAPALVLQLRDGSAEVRVAALMALGRVHGADAVDAITPLTLDRNLDVKHAAIAALGALARGGSADALRTLIGALGQGDDGAGALSSTPLREALVETGELAIPSLRAVLHGGASPLAASSAAWVLGELRATKSAADIIPALRRGALPEAAALHALIGAGTPSELPIVLEHLGDENASVRGEALAAARALLDPAHPDGRAVEPLIAVARDPKLTPPERLEVLHLLGLTGARRASPLLQGFASSHDVPTKLAVLDALAALGPTGADESLLALITDVAPEVRLHAALALASSGGNVARDALLDKLASGTEVDRAAALDALGGILVRAPSERAWKELGVALERAAGGERDAILVVLARAAPMGPFVERLARSDNADDRRTIATSCAGRADAAPLLQRLLSDRDATVRAEAAWSLGTLGLADSVPLLEPLTRPSEGPAALMTADAAIDGAGAVARIAGRTHAPAAVTALCALLHAPSPLVRANALVGLALSHSRCGDGALERTLLSDPSDIVRRGAAIAVGTTPRTDEERNALARCAASDRSGDVARVCEHAPLPPSGVTHPALAYIETLPKSDPHPHTAYAVLLSDGLVRAGTADRRGAFFDPAAPEGTLRLLGDVLDR